MASALSRRAAPGLARAAGLARASLGLRPGPSVRGRAAVARGAAAGGPRRRQALLGAGAAVGLELFSSAAARAEGEELATSASGLQWKDVEVGTGAAPVQGALISAHYTGTLENGRKFDSSYDRRQPLKFAVGVGRVIKGWDMGILGTDDIPPMKVGGKRKLVIPGDLAYGARGAGGGLIPPNATLVFDVELVGIGK